ncbi:ABC transporter permease [Microlunatus ginsengisoli]|uniref:ABC-2 type transporter transmembrane domain-containing protein n=1 Tax=Microlunatus ginsengisoli TaxID=363863 RepID=A0ABP7ABP0_9ACTN
MSAVTDPTRTEGVRPTRQVLALARSESTLLLRNKTALFTATLIPLMLVALLGVLPSALSGPPLAMSMVIGSVLLLVLYYSLVTSTVARREEHTLKRLYSSAVRPAAIMIGMALPLLILVAVQVIIGLIAVAIVMGLDSAPHTWLLLPAVIAGCAVWWVLALASCPFTKSVEAAQLTTMPLIMVALGLSGMTVPIGILPGWLQWAAQLSPMFPTIDLAFVALSATRVTGEAVGGSQLWLAVLLDLGVAAGWVLAGLWLLRRRFGWEPRR